MFKLFYNIVCLINPSKNKVGIVDRSRVLCLFKILCHKYINMDVNSILDLVQTLMHILHVASRRRRRRGNCSRPLLSFVIFVSRYAPRSINALDTYACRLISDPDPTIRGLRITSKGIDMYHIII